MKSACYTVCMSIEQVGASTGSNVSETGFSEQEKKEREADKEKPIGPLSDSFEERVSEFSAPDVAALLEQLRIPREPNKEVDIQVERERVSRKLEQVEQVIKTENEKAAPLEAARQSLGIKQAGSAGGTIEKLEKAREKLEKEQRQIELADEYNDVLASFSELSPDELELIQKTGKTKKGELLHNMTGHEIHSDIAKELASLYTRGGRHITWGALTKLSAIVDTLLGDALYPLKRFLHLGNG